MQLAFTKSLHNCWRRLSLCY